MKTGNLPIRRDRKNTCDDKRWRNIWPQGITTNQRIHNSTDREKSGTYSIGAKQVHMQTQNTNKINMWTTFELKHRTAKEVITDADDILTTITTNSCRFYKYLEYKKHVRGRIIPCRLDGHAKRDTKWATNVIDVTDALHWTSFHRLKTHTSFIGTNNGKYRMQLAAHSLLNVNDAYK